MSLSFTNPRDPENRALRGKIEEWLRECELIAAEERLAAVDEESDRCGPNCPHTETVLRIEASVEPAGESLGESSDRELRIHKPLVFVRRADVRALVR
ncbi:MAG: hypothetical protein NXI24_02485 [bacterium]|nr:hypothetical protein [bacterium]